MAVKFIVDIPRADFDAWQSLLASDRALAHRMGVHIIAQEDGTFQPGFSRSKFPLKHDVDHRNLSDVQRVDAIGYRPQVRPLSDATYMVQAGRVACLFVHEHDVDLAAERTRAQLLAVSQRELGQATLELVSLNDQPPMIPESPVGSNNPEDTDVA